MNAPITERTVRDLADRWYRALDEHVPLADVLRFLVEDDLDMVFPDHTCRDHSGFADWYTMVTNRFFDEEHTVTQVTVAVDGDTATVTIHVNWQAKVWNPPAPNSTWIGFDSDQTWVVVPGANGPLIRTYVVNSLDPMPGSPAL